MSGGGAGAADPDPDPGGDGDDGGSLGGLLAILAVALGLLVAVPVGAQAWASAEGLAEPDVTYRLESSVENGHTLESLSPDARTLTREAVDGADGDTAQVTVPGDDLPPEFRGLVPDDDGFGYRDDVTHVIRDDAVYRVETERSGDSVTVTFTRVEGVLVSYADASPAAREVIDRTRAAGGEAMLYGPVPEPFGATSFDSEVGEDTFYVRQDGEYDTLVVSEEIDLFGGSIFAVLVVVLLVAAAVAAVGAMWLARDRLSTRTAGTGAVGAAVVFLPSLVVHVPLLTTPARGEVSVLPLAAVVAVVVPAAYLGVLRLRGS